MRSIAAFLPFWLLALASDLWLWKGGLFWMNFVAWSWIAVIMTGSRLGAAGAIPAAAGMGITLGFGGGGPFFLGWFLAGALAGRQAGRLDRALQTPALLLLAALGAAAAACVKLLLAGSGPYAGLAPAAFFSGAILRSAALTAAVAALAELAVWLATYRKEKAPRIRVLGYGYRKVQKR